jgi:hypothetical protein
LEQIGLKASQLVAEALGRGGPPFDIREWLDPNFHQALLPKFLCRANTLFFTIHQCR